MKNQLEFLTNDLLLKESELYGKTYEKNDFNFSSPTYNDLSVHTLGDWLNSLTTSYNLTYLQHKNLNLLINALGFVLKTIDPIRIKDIQTMILEDTDLLFWRETKKGVSELTLEDDGGVVFRSTDRKTGKMQKGIFDEEIDFQKLLFKFLA